MVVNGQVPDQKAVAAPSPQAIYAERCARYAQIRDGYHSRWERTANLRLALFLVALLTWGVAIWQQHVLWYGTAVVLTGGFIAAIAHHRRLRRLEAQSAARWALNDEGLQRIARRWSTLPLRQPTQPPPDHLYAADLDLLGHASLQHLLNTPRTHPGLETLQSWLLAPAPPAVIRERQVAAQELAMQIDFRDAQALAGQALDASNNPEPLLKWAEDQGWLREQFGLVWLTRLLTLLTLGTLAAWSVGLLVYPLWIVGIIVNLGLILTVGSRADVVIERVSARQSALQAYATLFRLLGDQRWQAPVLQRLHAQLAAHGMRADRQMTRLGRIMAFADLRFSMFYFPIKLLTLWNFHVLYALEGWQQDTGNQARAWLQALGEAEALSALATLTFDNSHWNFPTITSDRPLLIAGAALGHPLLAEPVLNDVTVGPPGSFLLVTGSNMSGKSTLLRAIGVNVVLAQAGGPVCATTLQLPPVSLATSMRVQDSLEQGVSYFMAELKRLKAVVDVAQAAHAEQRTLLFLLDEILHGTNTMERQIAARQIIRYLVNLDMLGAVSTHDLALAEDRSIAASSQPVHFTETFTRGPAGPRMHFDYQLRTGLATSTNALKLMEIVGLPVDEIMRPV